jgi:hypothetical protein
MSHAISIENDSSSSAVLTFAIIHMHSCIHHGCYSCARTHCECFSDKKWHSLKFSGLEKGERARASEQISMYERRSSNEMHERM